MSWYSLWLTSASYITRGTPYIALGALLLALAAAVSALMAHRRIGKLSIRRGDSLEDTLGEISRRVRELQVFKEELEEYLKHAEARLRTSVRGTGLVRFTPFEGGGNLSFAAAFLDEGGSGMVVSSINTRSGQSNLYAKPIEKRTSQFELTKEEEGAITKAHENLQRAAISATKK